MLLVGAALANGLTSHVTISEYAIEHVPDGELEAIVGDPDLWLQLQNGTQFPDGGYPLGEAYAETAHWEPFQDRYLDWIRATYDEDYSSTEARQHVAFLMGLASHGMGDQVFDSLYMQRAYVYDAESDWENTSMDTATDVGLAAQTGGQDTVDAWADWATMVSLMADAGVDVDADTLQQGQALTQIAITFGRTAGADPEQQAIYEAQFPWAYAHILDDEVHGSPPWEAKAVAMYWQVRWARLLGEVADIEPLIYTFPPTGSYEHPTEADSVESRLTVVMSRGVMGDLLVADMFEVVDSAGTAYAVSPWLFYGTSSHAIHLVPSADWPADTDFTVTVKAGVPFIDGTYSERDASFTFSTGPWPESEPPIGYGCGCQAGGGGAWLGLAGLLALRRRRGNARATPTASRPSR